jgi:hypothetical protein
MRKEEGKGPRSQGALAMGYFIDKGGIGLCFGLTVRRTR